MRFPPPLRLRCCPPAAKSLFYTTPDRSLGVSVVIGRSGSQYFLYALLLCDPPGSGDSILYQPFCCAESLYASSVFRSFFCSVERFKGYQPYSLYFALRSFLSPFARATACLTVALFTTFLFSLLCGAPASVAVCSLFLRLLLPCAAPPASVAAFSLLFLRCCSVQLLLRLSQLLPLYTVLFV